MNKLSLKNILSIFISCILSIYITLNINLVNIEFNSDINFYIDLSPNIIYYKG